MKFTNLQSKTVHETVKDIIKAMEEMGYNPTLQLTAYIKTNNINYITKHNKARKKIKNISKEELLRALVDFGIINEEEYL